MVSTKCQIVNSLFVYASIIYKVQSKETSNFWLHFMYKGETVFPSAGRRSLALERRQPTGTSLSARLLKGIKIVVDSSFSAFSLCDPANGAEFDDLS